MINDMRDEIKLTKLPGGRRVEYKVIRFAGSGYYSVIEITHRVRGGWLDKPTQTTLYAYDNAADAHCAVANLKEGLIVITPNDIIHYCTEAN